MPLTVDLIFALGTFSRREQNNAQLGSRHESASFSVFFIAQMFLRQNLQGVNILYKIMIKFAIQLLQFMQHF